MAMMIVALIATMASAVLWHQWRSIQVEAAERGRAQAEWVLDGALDFARLILREDARTGGPDGLGEQWATRLEPARLSTFLAADRNNTDDAPDAFLSGEIADAQSRYNLRNLVATGEAAEAELATLQRLCEQAGLPSGTAETVAARVRAAVAAVMPPAPASAPDGGEAGTADDAVAADAPVLPEAADQFAWLGLGAAEAAALRRVATLLPSLTPLNVNTADREVLAAVIGTDLASAERLVQARSRLKDQAFASINEARAALPGVTLDPRRLGVSSRFFEVRGALDIGQRAFAQYWLIERRGLDVFAIYRRRLDALEAAAVVGSPSTAAFTRP
jgi:general secretion pathway protein K